MDAREAWDSIEQIRQNLARAEGFRGWRTASTACTGLLALVAAFIQWQWQLNDVYGFLDLWVITAGVGLAVVGSEMAIRYIRSESALARDATALAVRQFVPCLVAGMLLTVAMERFAFESIHVLPGLWAIIFSLGVFASRPGLPRAANFVAAFYLLAGLLVIATLDIHHDFAIWPMPLTFGGGQLLAAAVLYVDNERRSHASQ